MTRDHLPGTKTLPRAAALLGRLHEPARWAHPAEYDAYRAAVAAETRKQLPAGSAAASQRALPQDRRGPFEGGKVRFQELCDACQTL